MERNKKYWRVREVWRIQCFWSAKGEWLLFSVGLRVTGTSCSPGPPVIPPEFLCCFLHSFVYLAFGKKKKKKFYSDVLQYEEPGATVDVQGRVCVFVGQTEPVCSDGITHAGSDCCTLTWTRNTGIKWNKHWGFCWTPSIICQSSTCQIDSNWLNTGLRNEIISCVWKRESPHGGRNTMCVCVFSDLFAPVTFMFMLCKTRQAPL